MTPAFDLMDPEWLWTILILAATIIGAVVEWRRGGSEVDSLAVRVSTLEHVAVTAEDWADMRAQMKFVEKMLDKLLDEWNAAEVEEDA